MHSVAESAGVSPVDSYLPAPSFHPYGGLSRWALTACVATPKGMSAVLAVSTTELL